MLKDTHSSLQPARSSYSDLPPRRPLSLLSLPHPYQPLRLLLFRELCAHTCTRPTQVPFQTRISAVLTLMSQADPGPTCFSPCPGSSLGSWPYLLLALFSTAMLGWATTTCWQVTLSEEESLQSLMPRIGVGG